MTYDAAQEIAAELTKETGIDHSISGLGVGQGFAVYREEPGVEEPIFVTASAVQYRTQQATQKERRPMVDHFQPMAVMEKLKKMYNDTLIERDKYSKDSIEYARLDGMYLALVWAKVEVTFMAFDKDRFQE